jgi:hypothetical protein
MVGTCGFPDMPVASTSCRGRRVISPPSRSTTTVHSAVSSWYVAFVTVLAPQ